MTFNRLMRPAALLLALAVSTAAWGYRHDFDTVPGDPMKVKMYTLPNGLRIMMSRNTDAPRIQTNIAVRVGGKNDPAETTGLAHYFEHLMFKGTPVFGTSDYVAEKPMLDEIEALFETYRMTTDSTARAAIYHRIDSVSYEASKLAIPNEYDKLMTAIGAQGTNAYTSNDETCYVEDIPSNQLENWARIQAVRFKEPVLRGFHTELETIYEEKNMSLTSDMSKVFDTILAKLFPNHPYGTQTVLGSQEHLKNPSITNVKRYHDTWYRPNNMMIALSGDFDPDEAVDIIEKYFGDMQPNSSLPKLPAIDGAPLPYPMTADVVGQEAESVWLAWKVPGSASHDFETLQMVESLLSNGTAGLLDLNVNQQQRVLDSGAGLYDMADGSVFLMTGSPKEGQSLDEVRDILLGELRNVRYGNFDEKLLRSSVTNLKRSRQQNLESNQSRVDEMVSSFISGQDWKDVVKSYENFENLTKKDVTDVARRYLGDVSCVTVYKKHGKDNTIAKMPKPALTPIETNRDKNSQFLTDIRSAKVDPIEPVFVDFQKDLSFLNTSKGVPVLYKRNETNDLFSLIYVIETGTYADRLLGTALKYLDLLGTPDMTPEEIKSEYYSLGCDYFVSPGGERSYIVINGLSENMPRAMELTEKILASAVADPEVYADFVDLQIKRRDDAKGDQSSNFSALNRYAVYGEEMVKYSLSNDELRNLDPKQLTEAVKRLRDYDHRIIYYGPMDEASLLATIDEHHYVAPKSAPLPESRCFDPKVTAETVIYLAPYDSNQIYMNMVSVDGKRFDPAIEIPRKVYNRYFGADMSAIVFQEMRESRSLAYQASAGYSGVSRKDKPYSYRAFIATQNDKMMDAIKAFDEIINDMPRSDKAFALAKEGLESNLRTDRTIKDNVAWAYINAQDLGYDHDTARDLYEALPGITLDKIVEFQQANVKGRTYTYCILGRIEDLDIDALGKLGRVVILTPEQTFGY